MEILNDKKWSFKAVLILNIVTVADLGFWAIVETFDQLEQFGKIPTLTEIASLNLMLLVVSSLMFAVLFLVNRFLMDLPQKYTWCYLPMVIYGNALLGECIALFQIFF